MVENGEFALVMCNNATACSSKEILESYVKYGEECVKHLNGMFSFLLYNKEHGRLLVVRDKLGERPLYYSQLPTGVLFSTGLKEILQNVKYPAIRPHELAQPIRYNYPIELRRTWIEQIMRLKAGEYAVIDNNGIQLHTYFKRNHTPSFMGTKEQAISESLRLMRNSLGFWKRLMN